ncbi:hypothetical protein EYF80_040840 [Liparis tanakae]|uniref:Uncharacterized protein n=1 Tax=Liparis tanakae TaxID=230148 RepID=A0A4Z2G751_9TELE|nr:hypothetical protein EYF80_040840 [Liparis tanakae]
MGTFPCDVSKPRGASEGREPLGEARLRARTGTAGPAGPGSRRPGGAGHGGRLRVRTLGGGVVVGVVLVVLVGHHHPGEPDGSDNENSVPESSPCGAGRWSPGGRPPHRARSAERYLQEPQHLD